jgi:hypothetical protein
MAMSRVQTNGCSREGVQGSVVQVVVYDSEESKGL